MTNKKTLKDYYLDFDPLDNLERFKRIIGHFRLLTVKRDQMDITPRLDQPNRKSSIFIIRCM